MYSKVIFGSLIVKQMLNFVISKMSDKKNQIQFDTTCNNKHEQT